MQTAHLSRGADGEYLARWKRILHLDARLREGSRPSATLLARECGVSPKTIYRDLDAMRDELRAPIRYDSGRRGYHYSNPRYAIPAAALSERDLFALMVAENAVAQYEGTPLSAELRAAFDKILGLLPGEVRTRHELAARAVHFSGLPPTPIPSALWNDLTAAIEHHERVDIDYFTPAERRAKSRRVEPYLLVVRDREWFLVARTQQQRNYALFYLPRIRRLERSGEYFERDREFSAEAYYQYGFNAMHGSGKPSRVELRFSPEHAHIADERRWAVRQTVARRRNGAAIVSFESNALFEIERSVLRYGGAVEVLRPRALRESVRAAAARTAQRHAR